MRCLHSFLALTIVLVVTACHEGPSLRQRQTVDSLNSLAYKWHYKNIDSLRTWAEAAYDLAGQCKYAKGRAEALNNLAFERFQQMDFDSALTVAARAADASRSLTERLIADVTMMKVAQRTSDNRSFFIHRADAGRIIKRLSSREQKMTPRELHRFYFGRSDYHIASSTYFYYLNQNDRALDEIRASYPYCQMATDTAQWLYYCYMRGSGGLAENTEPEAVAREEFDYLLKCFWLARYENYPFFVGNSEQSLATLLADSLRRTAALEAFPEAQTLLSSIFPSDSLPEKLAEAALNDFIGYDDLYQEACALRTLGELSFDAGNYLKAIDYYSAALDCVNFHHQCYYASDELVAPDSESRVLVLYDSTPDPVSVERQWVSSAVVKTVPEWISGIRQQLSVAFSALDMKAESDYNRNIFLDLLDVTREDAELESRAVELSNERSYLHRLIAGAIATAVVISLFLFGLLRRWRRRTRAQRRLLRQKMQQVKEAALHSQQAFADEQEQLLEQQQATELRLLADKEKNIEKRAKLQLVQGIVPFLDRIINEVRRMRQRGQVRQESLAYISELTGRINELNDLLTEWIKMEQGQLSLQISSFELAPLFDAMGLNHYAYDQKGLQLNIEPTTLSVKADRALTLFMLNTLSDNARKFTPEGGTVSISAAEGSDDDGRYVELSVQDTGCGLSAADIDLILNNKVYDAAVIGNTSGRTGEFDRLNRPMQPVEEADATGRISDDDRKGYGFGLMNCKGIIEKYRKTSPLFRVCRFGIDSQLGKGSRFWFRLPRVVSLILLALAFAVTPGQVWSAQFGHAREPVRTTAKPQSADSESVLSFPAEAYALADSLYFCNLEGRHAEALDFAEKALALIGQGRDSLDYSLVLGVRNEQAVAALAMHDWALYRRSNEVYTRLYKLVNRDESLEAYCQQLERSQLTARWALAAIIALFVLAALAAYFFYFLPQARFARAVARLNDERLQQMQQQQSADIERQQADVEMAEDEHRRRLYEESRLHVQNQIIDNCLSTIKHETMYYPGRINQLVNRMATSGAPEADLTTLNETVGYYKEIYSLLMSQALHQSEALNFRRSSIAFDDICRPAASRFANRTRRLGVNIELKTSNLLSDRRLRGDNDLLLMLLNALLDAETDFLVTSDKGVGEWQPMELEATIDGNFARITICNPNHELSTEQLNGLFTPHPQGIPFLIAKQIIREHDTFMGHPGCRINAEAADKGHSIWFTIPLTKA